MAVVRINPRLEAEVTGHLASHGPMERVLGLEAERVARRARQFAHGQFYATGAYARGIKAESGVDEHGQLVGRVVATDWKSHWAEFGWGNRAGGKRARHILARAAQQVGFRVLGAQVAGAVGGAVARRAVGARSRQAIGAGSPSAFGGTRRAITGRR